MAKKKRGQKFKTRRPFNREEAFPKKAAQKNMAEEMVLFQTMVMSISRAFPDRDERMEYIRVLIDGLTRDLTMEDEEDGTCSDTDVEGSEEEAGEGESECAEFDGPEIG